MKQIFFAAIFCLTFFYSSVSFAADRGKIIFVPLDNRPVNTFQTIEVAEKVGYEVLVPPKEFLCGRDENFGNPEELWKWLNENTAGTSAAVISADSMIYGGLVASRKHDLTEEEVMARAKKFKELHENFPWLPIYVFGTIMRTPSEGDNSMQEPAYYETYGKKIFNFTALKDKSETEKLSRREKKIFSQLEEEIPKEYLNDWLERRKKNFNVTKYFIDLTRAGIFKYFFLGCDDSAIFSQTHLESRKLNEYGKDLGKTAFQIASGADEIGMLMMSRAINKDINSIPFISVRYNAGKGGETIPRYSNDKIKDDIEGEIIAIGGLRVPSDERADFVLAVSTDIKGKTSEASFPNNPSKPRKTTKEFMKIVNELAEKNYKILIADIAYGNGGDNALMEQLRKNNLQFKINGYGGWNTATNTTGFLLGGGVLTKFMSERDKNSLLVTRYLDDWIYQSNIRTDLALSLWKLPGEGDYSNLNTREIFATQKVTEMMKDFADENLILPSNISLKNLSVTFPWHRMFECDPRF